MSKHVFILLLALVPAAAVTQAQVISPPKQRSTIVGNIEAVIHNVDEEAGSYTSVASPFVMVQKEAPVVAKTATSQGPVETKAVPQVLTDKVALRAISQQFKPLGSLILGDRGLLQLGNGRTLERGSTFTAEIQGTTYEVKIEDVTKSGYTLRLGEATEEKLFLQMGK